ncbi:MAG: hypothetical protein NZ700_16745 [Gemmataceae bacterium]|nr:hypothetical protein [Gemmataceae bacterium]MDW8264398.1 hypothetical protein [Gemmataceae bacterium]
MKTSVVGWFVLVVLAGGPVASAAGPVSHPPMRPLPKAIGGELAKGPTRFVDPVRGDDTHTGTADAPWKSLRHALRQLRPGDTLYLRGGVYYERPALSVSGTATAPITLAAYPGELAIIDGGLREFAEQPATAWQPALEGAAGEYVSTRSYLDLDDRRVPHQFLPGSWEPMWGIEDDRPLALGHFADSMVPLHGYRLLSDLRADNELWIAGQKERDAGIYAGPGLWFNRQTGRVHIRLAHHRLAGLGDRAYRGETDPRKLPLVVAVGFGDDVCRISGIRHVRLRGLVFRGATGSPMIHVYGSEDVELDHVTVFGGFPGLLVNASRYVRVVHSAFRGLAAPWLSRAHMKYRGTPSYQVIFRDNQPVNENIEIAWCEFTDDHDFAFFRFVKNLRFHHNFVDNFNDDGLECGPKLRWHTMFVYQNRLGRCLIPLTQHEIDRDESPLDHDAGTGLFLYRNVLDMRGGTYSAPPVQPDPSGAYLRREGHLVGDHGSPTWPVMRVYHNTFLRQTPVFRDYFLFGLASQGLKNTERDVFNNIFVQTERVPGVVFGMKEAARLREGGNVLWGLADGPALKGDPLAQFRASPLFQLSRAHYQPGWTTHDLVADPRFVRLTAADEASDLRLTPQSPAVNFGRHLPADWPDPLREHDRDAPDSGALPLGVEPWGVGVDGRIPLSGPLLGPR